MAEAYIVEAVRTAGGRRDGKLAGWHPADMAGEVLDALVARCGIDPAALDDVIMGCVSQVGEQAFAWEGTLFSPPNCRTAFRQ
jgi:acetyl-CoA C-acetyltransferase